MAAACDLQKVMLPDYLKNNVYPGMFHVSNRAAILLHDDKTGYTINLSEIPKAKEFYFKFFESTIPRVDLEKKYGKYTLYAPYKYEVFSPERSSALKNHKKAIDYANKVLDVENLTKDFLKIVTRVNRLCLEGILEESSKQSDPYHYRSTDMILIQGGHNFDQNKMLEVITKHPSGNVTTFKRALSKHPITQELLPKFLQKIKDPFFFTADEKKQWDILITIIEPANIQKEMEKLFEKLKKVSESIEHETDPIQKFNKTVQLASFCHMKIVKIHPFKDAHGRTARIIANMILARGGVHPFVCFNSTEYEKAVMDSISKGNQIFIEYLKKIIETNIKYENFFS